MNKLYNWGIGFHGAGHVNGVVVLYNNSELSDNFTMTSTVFETNGRYFTTIDGKLYLLVGEPDEELKKQYYQQTQQHIYPPNPFIHAIQHELVSYKEDLGKEYNSVEDASINDESHENLKIADLNKSENEEEITDTPEGQNNE